MKENPRSSKSSNSGRPSHLLVGRVGRAVGLKGEVEVLVLSDAPERFASGSQVDVAQTARVLTVGSTRKQGDRTVVKFAEIVDRDQAQELKGEELFISLAQARELDQDEYWDHDLIGCTVVTVDGREVGRVADVLHQPSGSLLSVEGESVEHLIPLIRSVIREVVPGQRIVIEPIAGLLGD